MNVALDGTPLTVATGGIRRYTEELVAALQAEFPADAYSLVSDQLQPPKTWLARRWWFHGLPAHLREAKVDVFHGTDFSVPYRRVCASVMTVHDLSPWRAEPWQTGSDRVRRRTDWQLRWGLPTMVITPSEAIRLEVLSRWRITPDQVRAVPLAAASHFRPGMPFDWPRPYFLFVGTLEPRKNLRFLIDCWRAVRAEVTVDLLLCGRQRNDSATIPAEEGLHILGPRPEAEVVSLYNGAQLVLYPSLYEGFGLPVLEAMQCGAPVLTSPDPAITEVAGEAAWQEDATDTRAWVQALRTLAKDSDRLRELSDKGRARAAMFSWRRTARLTHDVYQEARSRFGR